MARPDLVINNKLPSLNEHIRKVALNRYTGGKFKKAVESSIIAQIESQELQPITEPVTIRFVWYEATCKRDKDNVAFAKKYILDALQKSHRLINDNNNYIKGFSDEFVYHRGQKVEIYINPAKEKINTETS